MGRGPMAGDVVSRIGRAEGTRRTGVSEVTDTDTGGVERGRVVEVADLSFHSSPLKEHRSA